MSIYYFHKQGDYNILLHILILNFVLKYLHPCECCARACAPIAPPCFDFIFYMKIKIILQYVKQSIRNHIYEILKIKLNIYLFYVCMYI